MNRLTRIQNGHDIFITEQFTTNIKHQSYYAKCTICNIHNMSLQNIQAQFNGHSPSSTTERFGCKLVAHELVLRRIQEFQCSSLQGFWH